MKKYGFGIESEPETHEEKMNWIGSIRSEQWHTIVLVETAIGIHDQHIEDLGIGMVVAVVLVVLSYVLYWLAQHMLPTVQAIGVLGVGICTLVVLGKSVRIVGERVRSGLSDWLNE
jgi:hypothetical protein